MNNQANEGSLTAYLRQIKQTLCVPAAEYVPAIGDAMLMLDRAIQMSYQTDPTWIRPAAPGGTDEGTGSGR